MGRAQANGRSRIVTIGKQSEALTAVPRQTFTIKVMSGPRVQNNGNSQNKFLRVEAIKLRTAAAQQAYINDSCRCWKNSIWFRASFILIWPWLLPSQRSSSRKGGAKLKVSNCWTRDKCWVCQWNTLNGREEGLSCETKLLFHNLRRLLSPQGGDRSEDLNLTREARSDWCQRQEAEERGHEPWAVPSAKGGLGLIKEC